MEFDFRFSIFDFKRSCAESLSWIKVSFPPSRWFVFSCGGYSLCWFDLIWIWVPFRSLARRSFAVIFSLSWQLYSLLQNFYWCKNMKMLGASLPIAIASRSFSHDIQVPDLDQWSSLPSVRPNKQERTSAGLTTPTQTFHPPTDPYKQLQ